VSYIDGKFFAEVKLLLWFVSEKSDESRSGRFIVDGEDQKQDIDNLELDELGKI
jgi:hypothetical protein